MSNDAYMSNDPNELRRQIADTRGGISNDVNALADAANPKNIADRQVDKVKEGAVNLKEKIFGSPYDSRDNGQIGDVKDAAAAKIDDARYAVADKMGDARDAVADKVGDAKDQVADAADQARGAVQQAPYQVKRATRGNPLAAGLIAFGVGALISGLFPATDAEANVAANVKDKAQPLVDQVQEHAQGLVEDIKPHVQDAAAELKDHAQQSVENVKQTASDAKDQVADQAKDSAQNVKDA